ncbi:FadR/GntR family transcriptional regulator [Kibdelosporangium aridum]|uniref:GntR family transcriptional regulator, transcriptional repressor for pyruvate dehydrogenase complex n=1 Tax=Kibdelosporangium aridum TaxID=2030 RepID=A0A1Y5Y7Y1_KIBAR|nr:FadR/GntR family transcriptional regulator [Kibdelosporangium aridum]SMD25296.1 GntR family transcriptional regulator, transcriptional repressor for pyruvate dehydrogenase complex [Kibdelosporangium aridum]
MSLTDEAISRIRELVRSGRFPAGAKLPAEHELTAELGMSRSPVREAVKALAVAGVLDVRRGDGTYVTSLAPSLLLAGLGSAVELMQGNTLLELMEVRRLLEPAATALAATRISQADLAVVHEHLQAMHAAADDVELLNFHDAAFHRAVITATGNEALATLLDGISSRTLRARVWRGMTDNNAAPLTLAQHTAIYQALVDGDAAAAHATALIHVGTSERWLREHMAEGDGEATF